MEDKKIIELFWARNEDAIAETDATYGRKLRALANKILNNWEDAEESVSDTYMKTWEIIPPQRPTYFYAFIASICRHLSFHKVDWKQAAKRNAEVVTLTEEMELCIPDTSRDREMEAREIGKALNAFLESLPKETLMKLLICLRLKRWPSRAAGKRILPESLPFRSTNIFLSHDYVS